MLFTVRQTIQEFSLSASRVVGLMGRPAGLVDTILPLHATYPLLRVLTLYAFDYTWSEMLLRLIKRLSEWDHAHTKPQVILIETRYAA